MPRETRGGGERAGDEEIRADCSIEVTDCGVDGIKMLKRLAEHDVRSLAGDEAAVTELALRSLNARKAFREVIGQDAERLGAPVPAGPRPHPKPHGGGKRHRLPPRSQARTPH